MTVMEECHLSPGFLTELLLPVPSLAQFPNKTLTASAISWLFSQLKCVCADDSDGGMQSLAQFPN